MRLTSKNGWRSPMDSDTISAMYKKLAAYEDTGYSPLEIKSLEGEWNAMRKVVDSYRKAEEQGRLVMLPCKVGDALFVTNERTVLPAVRMVESVAWHNGRVIIRAVNSRTGSDYYCSAEDFGKTVFLTREEAKVAMGRGKDNGTA